MEHISQSCFEALQRCEQEASKETYHHYLPFARHVVQRCGVRDMRQEDIIQTGFLRLFQSVDQLTRPESIAQWLAVTLRNLCFDEFRKETRNQRKIAEFAQSNENNTDSDFQATNESQLFEGQLYAETIRTLESTAGGDTLHAFYLEGLSVEEIAIRNKEAIGTVTARLSRVRKKLRNALLKKLSESGDFL